MNNRYECILIDVVNLCHKIFKKKESNTVQVGSKLVYQASICNFINSLLDLVDKYLHSEGHVYLLFDNYFSRSDLKTAFMFADRKSLSESYKETRKKENREFYNSINFLKYYYLLGDPNYHTLQITGLEADDLVKPVLEYYCQDKSCLFVTSDLDWCRYLSETPQIDWLPALNEPPRSIKDQQAITGFEISEKNIILYKAIFGDVSDNIDALVTNNEQNRQDFLELIKQANYPEEVVYISRNAENPNAILKAVSADERRFIINVQLVSSIDCNRETVEENLTSGNQSETKLKVIRRAIGLDEPTKFVFGNVKRPRV